MYPAKALKSHPFANPHRGQCGKSGQFAGFYLRSLGRQRGTVRVLSVADASRWLPHQGKQEIERRRRQRERLEAKRKLSMSSTYGKLRGYRKSIHDQFAASVDQMLVEETTAILKERAAQNVGVEIIPENRLGKAQPASDAILELLPDQRISKRVSWTSNGVQKVGEITHVVPAAKTPSEVGAKVKDAGGPRDHESFVVQANGKTYWPRVSLLNFE